MFQVGFLSFFLSLQLRDLYGANVSMLDVIQEVVKWSSLNNLFFFFAVDIG